MARDEIWYNGEYYHSIWRDQEEYVQALLSEDGETARIVWEKSSDWKYLGSENCSIGRVVIGNTSILFYNSRITTTGIFKVVLMNFYNEEYNIRSIDIPIDPSIFRDDDIDIAFYYSGYFYFTNYNRLIFQDTVLKINAYTGEYTIKDDYHIVFYINGVQVHEYERNRHFNVTTYTYYQFNAYLHQRGIGILTVNVRHETAGLEFIPILFKTTDFSHYYATNVSIDPNHNNCYCPTILPWPEGRMGNPNSYPNNIYMCCDHGWLVYLLYNPNGFVDRFTDKACHYSYANMDLCYTEDFEHYDSLVDMQDAWQINRLYGNSFSEKSLSAIYFRINQTTSDFMNLYIREPEGIYDNWNDALGFYDMTSMTLLDAPSQWVEEYDIFVGSYSEAGASKLGLLLVEDIYEIVDEYKEEQPISASGGLYIVKNGDYIYAVLGGGINTIYIYCVGI